ncbi:MAG: peptidase S9 [Candidatus Sericytochromatia bacterium]|nr:MAG: peptidase S9 [Candidatus Sericytochromatia bacterium]
MKLEELKLIPREVLFGNPVKTNPQISPNGKMMSYLAPVDNVLNLWVSTIGQNDDRPITFDKNRGVLNYFWAQDNKHIFYLQDLNGNENWRLYLVNIDTKEVKDLTPFENVQVQIIDHNKRFPNDIIIAMNKDNEMLHDIYHFNIETHELKKVAENPGNIISWTTDYNLKVRGAMASNLEGGFDLLIRDTEESEWKTILSWSIEDSLNSHLLGFTKDGNSIYLIDSRNANTSRLVKMNLKTLEIEVIAEDKIYDVSNVLINPDTYEVQMVTFNKERQENLVLDESIKEDINIISKLTRGDFLIYDRDNDDKHWLVGFTTDNAPYSFYSYDRENKKATFLFYNKPALLEYKLAEMIPISFKARDGLTIHGYLTLPPIENQKNLPMVLNVHGGPWYRDTWGYNPEAQWFANRGYACLQVNFRGSTGYGKDFLNAGDKEWGRKMHYDLIDAVNWAIEQGYADKERIAIYGGSYGGYAALVGATFTPDVFKCAIDIVGPSNIITLIKNIPPYWVNFLYNFKKRVGDPDTEEEFLKEISPLFKVDNIKIPILIAQGANDPRVKQSESEQIVEAMKRKGIDYTYMLFENEGHGFVKPENKIKFYKEAEKFLAKNLGGRYEE